MLCNLFAAMVFWAEIALYSGLQLWLWYPLGVGSVTGGLALLATRPPEQVAPRVEWWEAEPDVEMGWPRVRKSVVATLIADHLRPERSEAKEL
jgi:hypothetical protein